MPASPSVAPDAHPDLPDRDLRGSFGGVWMTGLADLRLHGVRRLLRGGGGIQAALIVGGSNPRHAAAINNPFAAGAWLGPLGDPA
jgi:hypothetical protein